MKKILLGFCLCLSFLLTGCSNSTSTKSVIGDFYNKDYSLGKEKTISIGDTLIRVSGVKNGAAIQKTLFKAENDIVYVYSGKTLTINKGETFFAIKDAIIENVDYYLIPILYEDRKQKEIEIRDQSFVLLLNKKTLEFENKYKRYANNNIYPDIYGSGNINFISSNNKLKTISNEYVALNPKESVNFDIIYNGISGDTLRFTYREFTENDISRPSFFQDLTYSKNDKIIKFRGIEIEIIKIKNSEIVYKIKSDNFVNSY